MREASSKEVEEIIASFKNKKAMGPHLLKFELLKYLSREGINYVTTWLNGALECGRVDPYLNTGINLPNLFNYDPIILLFNHDPYLHAPLGS